ncbi:MAG TPA: TIGR03067 domain-containing protein, partial [Gemmataceae bacterium]|nr:TIGR03067 domain-containing protein [Gemmataceae bacterium]
MRTGTLSLVAVGLALAVVAAVADPHKDAAPDRIATLVRQLGDKEYAKREAATKELDAIGEPARDALKAAVGGSDAEIRQRAQKVLDSLDARVRAAAAKADLEKLQGTWYTTAIQVGGGASGEDRFDTITYEGTKYVQRRKGYVWAEGTIEIVDATVQPKRIDYFGTEGGGKGLHVCSIYTLNGEEHAICSGADPAGRPGEFSGKVGFLRVTRREKTPPRLPETR